MGALFLIMQRKAYFLTGNETDGMVILESESMGASCWSCDRRNRLLLDKSVCFLQGIFGVLHRKRQHVGFIV